MSRTIQSKSSLTVPEEERALHDTADGKLLFTLYRDRKCILLLQNNRLTAAAFPEESKIGGIYIGKVKNIVKNINACFVEIAGGEICFLPLKEALYPLVLNRSFNGKLLEGDELPVQVVRDAQKTKQASVTAHISLANDFFALSFGPERTGFSSKLDKEQKRRLSDILTEGGILCEGCLPQSLVSVKTAFPVPPVGMVVRTKVGELLRDGRETVARELLEQFQSLLDEWKGLLQNAATRTCYSCLKKADDNIFQTIDSFISPEEYRELLTDDETVYLQLQEYISSHRIQKEVRLYRDEMLSLNKLYGLDSKLETALGERVWLKSGGYLVIQPTEALTVIDVNSGKYEAKNKAGEEAALRVNREAAEEIALQLRVRNLSGIIIVDFINMETESSRREIIECMKRLTKRDKVRTTVVDMTPLGLMEITRRKITRPLSEQFRR